MKKKKFSKWHKHHKIKCSKIPAQLGVLLSSPTKLTRHLAWIITLLKNWLNYKRGHSNKEDFNYLTFKEIQDTRALLLHLA